MIAKPYAKINIGLNVIEKRLDGYHNIESIFYPIPLTDTLQIEPTNHGDIGKSTCHLVTSGIPIDSNAEDNLVVRAYRLIAADYQLPPVEIHLHKSIPSEAGLGGGSSDAAYTIRLLNNMFDLNMPNELMHQYAAQLGADCPFFINSEPSFVTSTGDAFAPISKDNLLSGYTLVVIKPSVSVSTREAYSQIIPRKPQISINDAIERPINEWKNIIQNDFELSVFKQYPTLKDIKENLYKDGAIYAQMSGSGSAIYGIFSEKPAQLTCSADAKIFILPL